MKLYFKEVTKSLLNIKVDKRNECYNWGNDNAFPSLVDALIDLSVTAKTCWDRCAKSIYGKSFGDNGNVIVNSKGQTLNELLRIAARQYAKFNNIFIHLVYNGLYEIKGISVISATDVRVGKSDDNGYSGKYIVYDNWDKNKGKKIQSNDFKICYKFNPDPKIVKKQILGDGNGTIEAYKGQILHIKKDDTKVYSMSDIGSVLSEALLESNSQTFRSRGANKGFLNTKLLTVPPFKDEDIRKEFKNDLNELRGAEGSNDVLLLETSTQSDDVSKQIDLSDLSGTYNDKLFEYSDKQAEKNICKAFTVPLMLVSQTDNSLFGSSGEMIKEAKLQLWESREEDREQIEAAFKTLLIYFDKEKINDVDLKIINPYIEEDAGEININKQAQANLRGSVGGVQGILDLVKAVKDGSIDNENAVEVIKNIYGFSEKKAKGMIGGFDSEQV